jgi:hypothetical protein
VSDRRRVLQSRPLGLAFSFANPGPDPLLALATANIAKLFSYTATLIYDIAVHIAVQHGSPTTLTVQILDHLRLFEPCSDLVCLALLIDLLCL